MELYEFSRYTEPECFSCVIQGERISGKSTLCAHIVNKLGVNRIEVFCGHFTCQSKWSKLVDPNISTIYGPDGHGELNDLIVDQRKRIDDDRNLFLKNTNKSKYDYKIPSALYMAIVLDGIEQRKEFTPLIAHLTSNHSELGIYVIRTTQRLIPFIPNFHIITRCNSDKVIDTIWQCMKTEITQDDFKAMLCEATKTSGSAFLIDNTRKTNRVYRIEYDEPKSLEISFASSSEDEEDDKKHEEEEPKENSDVYSLNIQDNKGNSIRIQLPLLNIILGIKSRKKKSIDN